MINTEWGQNDPKDIRKDKLAIKQYFIIYGGVNCFSF